VAEDENYESATSKAVKLTIKKADNTLKVSPSKKTVKQAKLTEAKSFTIKAKKAKGKVFYISPVAAQKAGISVSQSGKVVIPKKCKKGTYKIRVYAAGTTNYKAKNLYTVITVQ